MTEKKCSKCGEIKAVELFGVGSNQCRSCIKARAKARAKAYREANPDKVKAAVKAYREANPDKVKAVVKAWQDANPDKVKATKKAWADANRDKVKAVTKAKDKKRIENLTDGYVTSVLKLTKAQTTPELIASKREQLILIRLTREIKNERKSTINPS